MMRPTEVPGGCCKNSGWGSFTGKPLAPHGHRHVKISSNIVLKKDTIVFAKPKILLQMKRKSCIAVAEVGDCMGVSCVDTERT